MDQELLERPDGITELFSSASSPSRVGMMALLTRGAQVVEGFVWLFPFNFQGKFERRTRERGSALLLELRDHEESAVVHMKEALSRWPWVSSKPIFISLGHE